MEKNYIEIHRDIVEWEWYKHTDVFCLYIHCLLACDDDGFLKTTKQSLSSSIGLEVPRLEQAIQSLYETNYIDFNETPRKIQIKIHGAENFKYVGCEICGKKLEEKNSEKICLSCEVDIWNEITMEEEHAK